jgi:hypothetical protein
MAENENPGALAGATGAGLSSHAIAADISKNSKVSRVVKVRAVICWRWIVAIAARVAS